MEIKNISTGIVNLWDLILPDGRIGLTLAPNQYAIFFNEEARRSVALVVAFEQKVIEKISNKEPVGFDELDIELAANGRVDKLVNYLERHNEYVGFVRSDLKGILTSIMGIGTGYWQDLTVGVTNEFEVVNRTENDLMVSLYTPDFVLIEPSRTFKLKNGIFNIKFINMSGPPPYDFRFTVKNDREPIQNVHLDVHYVY